jgi:predicted ArsR family transcriptional regulator
MQSTRQRILTYLNTYHQATAPQLATIFDRTQANIRYHLNILQQDGHIEIVGQSPHSGAGRPTYIYMLTKESQEDALDQLASALLEQTISARSVRQRNQHLQGIADKLIRTQPEPQKSITLQLSAAIQRLNELRYKSHWEAHIDGPKILFAQCPYAKIINRHPELCEMDALLISTLTGIKCQLEQKISRSQAGPDHCQFILLLE